LDIGGSIFYMMGEGGETSTGTNFNYLLEEYGISVNAGIVFQSFEWDCVAIVKSRKRNDVPICA
jgi:hypothetical protein